MATKKATTKKATAKKATGAKATPLTDEELKMGLTEEELKMGAEDILVALDEMDPTTPEADVVLETREEIAEAISVLLGLGLPIVQLAPEVKEHLDSKVDGFHPFIGLRETFRDILPGISETAKSGTLPEGLTILRRGDFVKPLVTTVEFLRKLYRVTKEDAKGGIGGAKSLIEKVKKELPSCDISAANEKLAEAQRVFGKLALVEGSGDFSEVRALTDEAANLAKEARKSVQSEELATLRGNVVTLAKSAGMYDELAERIARAGFRELRFMVPDLRAAGGYDPNWKPSGRTARTADNGKAGKATFSDVVAEDDFNAMKSFGRRR